MVHKETKRRMSIQIAILRLLTGSAESDPKEFHVFKIYLFYFGDTTDSMQDLYQDSGITLGEFGGPYEELRILPRLIT